MSEPLSDAPIANINTAVKKRNLERLLEQECDDEEFVSALLAYAEDRRKRRRLGGAGSVQGVPCDVLALAFEWVDVLTLLMRVRRVCRAFHAAVTHLLDTSVDTTVVCGPMRDPVFMYSKSTADSHDRTACIWMAPCRYSECTLDPRPQVYTITAPGRHARCIELHDMPHHLRSAVDAMASDEEGLVLPDDASSALRRDAAVLENLVRGSRSVEHPSYYYLHHICTRFAPRARRCIFVEAFGSCVFQPLI